MHDLATQWIQSYLCKTKSFHVTEKSVKFLEPSNRPKVEYTDNSMEFGKSFEGLSWKHRTSTPHRSETNGKAERVVRRVKEVRQQYGYSQDWMKGGGLTLWNAIAICEISKTSWQMGKPPCERRFWRTIPRADNTFWSMVECHPTSPKDLSRIHQFGKKILPGIFLGYELIAMKTWRGNILISDLKDLEKLDAPNIYPRRINAKEVLIRQKDRFPIADDTAKLSGRDYEFREPTQSRKPTVRSEDLSGEIQGGSGESQPAEPTEDAEARADFWSVQGDLIYRHQIEPRVHLYVPKEETFPNSTKIDVSGLLKTTGCAARKT